MALPSSLPNSGMIARTGESWRARRCSTRPARSTIGRGGWKRHSRAAAPWSPGREAGSVRPSPRPSRARARMWRFMPAARSVPGRPWTPSRRKVAGPSPPPPTCATVPPSRRCAPPLSRASAGSTSWSTMPASSSARTWPRWTSPAGTPWWRPTSRPPISCPRRRCRQSGHPARALRSSSSPPSPLAPTLPAGVLTR